MTAPAPRDLLYGRRRGHSLRIRQQRLLAQTLPRLRHDPADSVWAARFETLWLEVGFGGGEHALSLAAAHPDIGLIACEVFQNGLCSLLGRLVEQGAEATGPLPPNLRLWDADARPLLRSLPDRALDRLFLMFPDPWPKTRHQHRRFVCAETIALAARVLRTGGEWRIASDDPTYQIWVTACLDQQMLFAAPAPTPHRPDGWPPTRYEAKALKAGRQPLYWTLIRQDRDPSS